MISDITYLVSTSIIIIIGLVMLYSNMRKRSPQTEICLIVDIGSGSVTSALVQFPQITQPILLASKTANFDIVDSPNSSKLIDAVASSLEKSIPDVITLAFSKPEWKNKDKSIKTVLVSFSSPWFVMKTKRIVVEKDKEFIVTKDFVSKVISNEVNAFNSELGHSQYINSPSFQIIEKSMVHSRVNGYDVSSTLNKKTKSYDAYICMAAIQKPFGEKVVDIIAKNTHISGDRIIMHTFPIASMSVVRDMFPDDQNFILLDITGEVTDVTLVIDGVVSATTTFPFGRHSLIRGVAKNLNTTPEVAESNIKMFIAKKMNDPVTTSMEQTITLLEKEWAVYFEDSLSSLSPMLSLPKKVYITADSDTVDVFTKFIEIEKTDKTAVWKKNLSVTYLGKEFLAKHISIKSEVQVDEFVTLLTSFYNSIRFLK